MANPILEISDGVTSVNLIESTGGFGLRSWRPAIAGLKSGGVWQNNPMADGRRLVINNFDNVIETFDLTISAGSQDSIIEKGQKLRRLLQDAREYWTSNRNDARPVYIRARAPNETNIRYAIIYDWNTPNDPNPFTTPFFGCGNSAVPELTMVVERGHWMADAPLSSTCVQINNQQAYEEANEFTGSFSVSYTVVAPNDGCSEYLLLELGQTEAENPNPGGANSNLLNSMTIGVNTSIDANYQYFYYFALRFRSVNIPRHALIDSAYIRFTADVTSPAGTTEAYIYAEKRQNPPMFEPYSSGHTDPLRDRMESGGLSYYSASWTIPAVTAGNTYDTPDLSDILQEMVDAPFWLEGDNLAMYFDYLTIEADVGHNHTKVFQGLQSPYDPTPTPPVLYVEYHIPEIGGYGQEDTCDAGKVFVANKHNRANISDIYYYDNSGAAYSANLMGAGLPYDLLPNPTAVDDVVYFGINTSLQNSGPFCSLVFDIGTANDNITGKWQYYDGAAWQDLDVTDNTVDIVQETTWSNTGVNSVHWIQPSTWVAVAVNGVTGYWVRFYVTAVDAPIVTPTQQNRIVYTIVTPFVDIDAAQVGGDIPALSTVCIQNMSDDYMYNVKLEATRVIAALRSKSRGQLFTPYINFGWQNIISCTIQSIDAEFEIDVTPLSSTGYSGKFTPSTVFPLAPVCNIEFQGDELSNYIGDFRVFLRTRTFDLTPDTTTVRLSMSYGEGNPTFYTDEIAINPVTANACTITDMGLFSINPGSLNPNEYYEKGTITLYMSHTGNDGTWVEVIDLILMPVDEWICDTHSRSSESLRMVGWHGAQRELRIDGIGNPRFDTRSVLFDSETGLYALDIWPVISSSTPILQANKDQRLWFLVFDTDRDVPDTCSFEACHAIRVYKSQRYFSMRGSR